MMKILKIQKIKKLDERLIDLEKYKNQRKNSI